MYVFLDCFGTLMNAVHLNPLIIVVCSNIPSADCIPPILEVARLSDNIWQAHTKATRVPGYTYNAHFHPAALLKPIKITKVRLIPRLVPVVLAELDRRRAALDAATVDEDVDLAHLLEGLREHALDGREVREVALDDLDAPAQRADRIGGRGVRACSVLRLRRPFRA